MAYAMSLIPPSHLIEPTTGTYLREIVPRGHLKLPGKHITPCCCHQQPLGHHNLMVHQFTHHTFRNGFRLDSMHADLSRCLEFSGSPSEPSPVVGGS